MLKFPGPKKGQKTEEPQLGGSPSHGVWITDSLSTTFEVSGYCKRGVIISATWVSFCLSVKANSRIWLWIFWQKPFSFQQSDPLRLADQRNVGICVALRMPCQCFSHGSLIHDSAILILTEIIVECEHSVTVKNDDGRSYHESSEIHLGCTSTSDGEVSTGCIGII